MPLSKRKRRKETKKPHSILQYDLKTLETKRRAISSGIMNYSPRPRINGLESVIKVCKLPFSYSLSVDLTDGEKSLEYIFSSSLS